ncbi:MAG: hypothetical protein ABIK36_21075 [Pseudomonadota bacterium]
MSMVKCSTTSPVRSLSGTGMTTATLTCSGAISSGSRLASLVIATGPSEAHADRAKNPTNAEIDFI